MLTKKQTIIAVVVLLLVAVLFFAIYLVRQDVPASGAKRLDITVIHGDQSRNELTITTEEEYLRGALENEGLIAGDESAYGLFIHTVDGETANDSMQQWWKISKDGEMLNTGADTTPVYDGDNFEFELVTGY